PHREPALLTRLAPALSTPVRPHRDPALLTRLAPAWSTQVARSHAFGAARELAPQGAVARVLEARLHVAALDEQAVVPRQVVHRHAGVDVVREVPADAVRH